MSAETREQIVEGVLASDRVGEVKFVNFDRFTAEGIKPQPDLNGITPAEAEENDESANTLFGQ